MYLVSVYGTGYGNEIIVNNTPRVTTPTSANVATTTATLGGTLINNSHSKVTELGIVYAPAATNRDPFIGGADVMKATAMLVFGVFTVNVTGLLPNTDYVFKAYAINSTGPGYSPAASFKTLAAASNVRLLINEFRFGGTGGAGDWYVELYNPLATSASTNGLTLGFTDATGNQSESIALTPNLTIPARGFFLIAGPQYSLNATAMPDQTVGTFNGLTSLGGVGIFGGSVAANTKLDTVGVTGVGGANAFFVEGTALLTPGSATNAYAFVRSFSLTSGPVDTNNNRADFVLVAPSGGMVNGNTAQIGSPNPNNATGPRLILSSALTSALLDAAAAQTAAPNRVRVTTDTGTNATFGTLLIRRSFTNNTGAPVRVLRFNVYDLTNSTTGSLAWVNVMNATGGDTNTSTGLKTVQGARLRVPSSEPGGHNATLEIALPSALANGQTAHVEFRLGVMRSGTFRFNFRVEAQ